VSIILLVEDDSDLRKLYELYLKPFNHEVHHAINGLEALYGARALRPDLVILDLMMPTASGDLVLGYIRSTEEIKNTPVLVVSAHSDVASLARQYEADGYLQKPVTSEDFLYAVQQLVRVTE
jgi:DNA-binding response OmpR family regulator